MYIFPHEFKGFGIHRSVCRVYLQKIDDTYHICFEDLGIGTSVTNASEQLATEVIAERNISPENCKFYETYNHKEGRTFDEITYTWTGNVAKHPKWKPSDAINIFPFEKI